MRDLLNVLWIEVRKAVRSRVPLFTLLGFLMLPLACGFLMFVYKNPQFARDMGLVSAKANLVGGSADWPFFLSMLAQGMAIGGLLLFSLVASWVFGREFSDGTVKDLLAVPVSRWTILLAKFLVMAGWCLLLTLIIYLVSMAAGAVIGLPQGSPQVLWEGSGRILFTACLVIVVTAPVALFASVGRGYLLPMGLTFLILALANVIAILGWGSSFPWSIPALYAGMVEGTAVEPGSLLVVALTGAAGIAATGLWWNNADQSR